MSFYLISYLFIFGVAFVSQKVSLKIKQPDFLICIIAGLVLSFALQEHSAQQFLQSHSFNKKEWFETVLYIGKIILCWYIFWLSQSHQHSENFVIKAPAYSFVFCFILSCGVSFLFLSYKPLSVHYLQFMMVFGLAFSITALPVLTRILEWFNLLEKPLGQKALNWAIVNDLLIFVLMPFIISKWDTSSTLKNIIVTIIFILLLKNKDKVSAYLQQKVKTIGVTSFVFITLIFILMSYLNLPLLSIAFGMGYLCRHLPVKINKKYLLAFLPFYFVLLGLQVNIDFTIVQWLPIVVLIFLSITLKFVSTWMFDANQNKQEKIHMMFLMNTKGVVELVFINMALAQGLINQSGYLALLVMTIIGTLLTSVYLNFRQVH